MFNPFLTLLFLYLCFWRGFIKGIHHPSSLYTRVLLLLQLRARAFNMQKNPQLDKSMNNCILISNRTTVCVHHSGVCVGLATGILTLQVQLPVLRPHLRRGITAYYSSTNNSPSAHQPAGSQTQAAEKGVRGVTLAPGCANSRLVTFYQCLIHYLENLFAFSGFLLWSSTLFDIFPPMPLTFFFFSSFFVWCSVLFYFFNRVVISSSVLFAISIQALSTEP